MVNVKGYWPAFKNGDCLAEIKFVTKASLLRRLAFVDDLQPMIYR
jgi:hypothetical protein